MGATPIMPCPTPNNGRPYYCNTCGLGYAEYVCCDEQDCKLESEQEAQVRQTKHEKISKLRRRLAAKHAS